MPNSFPAGMSNREMASVLFNIATILRKQGNVNPWRTTAYERGARSLMGLRREAAAILETEARVPFHPDRHIGKKLQAKIKEMAGTGSLVQYGDMLAELPPHLQSLLRIPGMGLVLAERVHRALGVEHAADLVRAARDGRLGRVPGFGPGRVGAIAAIPIPGVDRAPSALPQPRLFDLPEAC